MAPVASPKFDGPEVQSTYTHYTLGSRLRLWVIVLSDSADDLMAKGYELQDKELG